MPKSPAVRVKYDTTLTNGGLQSMHITFSAEHRLMPDGVNWNRIPIKGSFNLRSADIVSGHGHFYFKGGQYKGRFNPYTAFSTLRYILERERSACQDEREVASKRLSVLHARDVPKDSPQYIATHDTYRFWAGFSDGFHQMRNQLVRYSNHKWYELSEKAAQEREMAYLESAMAGVSIKSAIEPTTEKETSENVS